MPGRSDFYELVVAEWRRRGVQLMPPAPEAEVVRLFADLGCLLSADVKRLYAVAGGFVDFETDADMWSFWSLDRIREESGTKVRPFVPFADWMICSQLYCLHYEGPETSSIYTGGGAYLEGRPIADSLAEFLEKLLADPDGTL